MIVYSESLAVYKVADAVPTEAAIAHDIATIVQTKPETIHTAIETAYTVVTTS